MSRPRRWYAHALMAVAMTVALWPDPAAAAPAAKPTTPPAPKPVQHKDVKITLPTGDVVSYVERPGAKPTATVEQQTPRPDGAPVSFPMLAERDNLYVIPSDAEPHIRAGTVDKELFNVAVRSRDRRAANTIPVLAKHAPGQVRALKALPAAKVTATARTAGFSGLRVEASKAAEFWRSVVPSTGARDHAPKLRNGVTKLALDRPLKVSLDVSVPMVGAPKAWQDGHDGKGVTVGVLDTGIDAGHPDFDGKIAEAKSFIEGEDTKDTYGHGTHVASTIAGSGKASDGKYKGVAPGAKLLIGKVCDVYVQCPTSAIMAGMEWAAGKAKVINISLGGPPTDGTDELSKLVDTLTEKTGTLFVIAAGNDGCTPCVSEPAVATSALAVGAVDKADKLAWFSNRGPRLGDATVKPEIVAPGVAITAARAKDTFPDIPGDPRYVAIGGTSMATPHVAGAAAIAAQAKPSAKAAQLKDTLVTAAKDVDLKWNEQGAGRLDVARAVKQKVSGPATASLGKIARDGAPVTHKLTYANDKGSPVTLKLALKAKAWAGADAPADAAKLSAESLTVPAGGQASVDLTVNPKAGEHGVYGGLITATGDNDVRLRTPVSWYAPRADLPTHKLTIRTTGFNGKTATDDRPFIERDTPTNADTPNDPFKEQQVEWSPKPGADGTWTATVPAGRYSVLGSHCEMTHQRRRCAALADSNVTVAADRKVALDARKAVPATARTRERVWQYDHQLVITAHVPGAWTRSLPVPVPVRWKAEMYATPAAPAVKGAVIAENRYALGEPVADVRARAGRRVLDLKPDFDPYQVSTRLPGNRSAPLVYAGAGQPGDFDGLDVKGKAALVRIPAPAGSSWEGVIEASEAAEKAAENAAKAGATILVPYLDAPQAMPIVPPGGSGGHNGTPIPVLSIGNASGDKLRTGGAATLETSVRPNPRFMYNLHYSRANGIPADLTESAGRRKLKRTRSRYHADRPGLALTQWWYAARTNTLGGYNPQIWLEAPAEIDHYVGPLHDKQLWRRWNSLTNAKDATFGQADNAPYRGRTENWFGGPLTMVADDGPEGSAAFARFDRDLFWASPWLGDSAPGHLADADSASPYPFSYRMFHEGKEIPPQNVGGAVTPGFTLSAEPGTYRLEGTFVLPKSGWGVTEKVRKMSPRVDNVWTFRSRRPPEGSACGEMKACAVQPLLQLRHDHGTDVRNQVRAGRPHRLRITAIAPYGSSGAGKIAGLQLSYSTDQGKTWRKGIVIGHGGKFSALVKHPAAPGPVWLRSEAWDTAGNRIQQTIQNAYELIR